ncbi:MAG: DUF502 domain-containing protein [Steroidobacteraceae bacterium]
MPELKPTADGDETATGNANGRRHPARQLRNYLIAGLLIWIPVMVTVWVIKFLSGILDQSLVLLPPSWRPEALVGQYVPGVGIVLSFLLLLVTGLVVRNLFGGQIVEGFENLVRRIPVIGAVYGGAKTFSETVLTDKGKSFKQVVMVEFPRPGAWSIGFLMSENLAEIRARTGVDLVNVFVPTTPNPTTGFLIAVDRREVHFMDMSVDDAFKMIFTLGVITPDWRPKGTDRPNLAPQQPPP